MAYYADLLFDDPRDERQDEEGEGDGLDDLTDEELVLARQWLALAGVEAPDEPQNPFLWPVRQALGVLARRRGGSVQRCGRVVAALIREVSAYTGQRHRREAARDRVAEVIRRARPSVVVAHSLGSVVAYETLHAHPELEVDLLVTLGSPLGAPGAVFHALDPAPRGERGAKPAGVARWEDYADLGDLVALPPELGGRFPVDHHANVHIGLLDFHTLGAYLRHPEVARVLTRHVDR
ncbi:serine peptidase [Actinosynnema sp. NPDC059797]